ncbi:hypothetical protein AwErysi_00920 [Erysipelotrichaceae bacterium]|nr:hypothetical protein AwErysi_00920 [Erysipelotrichaceae bacterium]
MSNNILIKKFFGETQPYFNDALHVRKVVFSREQGYDSTIDYDSIDQNSWHIVIYDNNTEIATARLYRNFEQNVYGIGRVAVMHAYRGQNLGKLVMDELIKQAIASGEFRRIILHSQVPAQNFYQKLGFTTVGEIYLEEGQPHISMELQLRVRGFEIAHGFEHNNIMLPIRKTRESAGYDLEICESITIPAQTTMLAKTGLKAYMLANEVLELHIRSSVAIKQNVWCANNVGIVDADYYSNPSNDGHIMIPLYNANNTAVTFNSGERVAQAIFKQYLTIDGENTATLDSRSGGFGSTNK